MAMHFSTLREPAPGDLRDFRDAALTYAAALRAGAPLVVSGPAGARDLLLWLGIEHEDGFSTRATLQLPAWSSPPRASLSDYRAEGYLPETMFAALVRSSYGPASGDFFPTRSELGFYFDEAELLRGEARWDESYLEACQAFFMEELMPAELVEKSLLSLPAPVRSAALERSLAWESELHGVTFLVASDLERVAPLATLLAALLEQDLACPGLSDLLRAMPEGWDPESWHSAWEAQPSARRLELETTLCPGFADRAEAILYTAGPRLLAWRAAGSAAGATVR